MQHTTSTRIMNTYTAVRAQSLLCFILFLSKSVFICSLCYHNLESIGNFIQDEEMHEMFQRCPAFELIRSLS